MPDEKPQIVILSPKDVKPGSIDPQGRIVERARLWATAKAVIVDVKFEDGTGTAIMWPSGSGWTVDGKTAP